MTTSDADPRHLNDVALPATARPRPQSSTDAAPVPDKLKRAIEALNALCDDLRTRQACPMAAPAGAPRCDQHCATVLQAQRGNRAD